VVTVYVVLAPNYHVSIDEDDDDVDHDVDDDMDDDHEADTGAMQTVCETDKKRHFTQRVKCLHGNCMFIINVILNIVIIIIIIRQRVRAR
jgi:hypothetical protein